MEVTKTYKELEEELTELRLQLEEANDTIEAIRSGEIDALVVKEKDGPQLYTLRNADQTYRIFIEQMTEGAVTLNGENLILYCNSQFASLVQLPLEKVTGRSLFHFIAPECGMDATELLQQAWSDKTKGELRLMASDGKQVPVLLSFKTLYLEEGLSMSIILTDLTQQKETQELLKQKNQQLEEAQKITQQLNASLEIKVKERTGELEAMVAAKTKIGEELRSNQERLSLILETMAEGVGIIDTEGMLTYANPMAQKILGLHHNEILSRTYGDPKWNNLRIDGSPLPDEEHPMATMMATGKPVFDYEIAVQPPDRERFYISINAAPIRDNQGKLIGGVGTFMDVTNRRKMTQQKDEFISVASHELKTPMTTLKASFQVLEQVMESGADAHMLPVFLSKARISLHKLTGLIDDLLNVSRLEKGQLILNLSSFNMYEAVQENVENMQFAGTNTDTITVNGNRDLIVLADKYRIEQVVTNLLTNAVKYSPPSSVINIQIEASGTEEIKVSVTDYGIGIPEDKQAQLFDRYYRVDYSGNQYSGLGLGLYISSEIIKKHKGQIGVNSQLGRGSTFWFTLPLR